MKLRLRSRESKETLKIEVPTGCSVQQLKDTFYERVSSPSASVRFSLNGKDELNASSTHDSLQSLGITSGDLIFFSFSPSGFSTSQSQTLIEESNRVRVDRPEIEQSKLKESVVQDLPAEVQSEKSKNEDVIVISDTEIEQLEEVNAENMDVDDTEWPVSEWVKSSFEPLFLKRVLKRVLKEEMCAHVGHNKLLVIAVHAVMLDSGFRGFDLVSGMKLEMLQLPEMWPSTTFSTWYTLPELLDNGQAVSDAVVLKFQKLGHFVNVFGCLSKGKSELHRVCLNGCRFLPIIDSVLANNESSSKVNETEIFEFWKIVKDGIVLPLMIDICEESGFVPPACFMRLTADLNLKILKALPGVDIAKIACVCSELRYLSSNQDLWKQKVEEEFTGVEVKMSGLTNWKGLYSFYWENKKKRKRDSILRQGRPRFGTYIPFPNSPFGPPYIIGGDYDAMPGLVPFGAPNIIGGDYDAIHGLGIPPPFAPPGRSIPRFRMRRNFSPDCNLGGFSA